MDELKNALQYEIIGINDGYRVRTAKHRNDFDRVITWVADFASLEDAELFVKIKRINDILTS